MSNPEITEKAFESAIEAVLIRESGIVSEPSSGSGRFGPGGFQKRVQDEYDRTLRLVPCDVLDFIYATQPEEWKRLKQHHGHQVKDKFLKRLSKEIQRRGVLDVLRGEIRDSGCKFRMCYFQPSSSLNVDHKKLYIANIFSVVRQLHYSERNENSLDLALFMNGIPIFTAELKNPLTGQTVEDAINQYRLDRDPREPLLSYRTCLAHFAIDPDLVYVTTKLAGRRTRFLPFNRGKFGGAGNPPVPPTLEGYPTSYLWENIWARDSILNLVQHFIHEFDELDQNGNRTGNKKLIFPRYHQLDCVQRLVSHSREFGPGHNYLIEHSAGSGKSNSIAWLAHQLSVLHDENDERVFDSIVVITDRKVLDRQLQRTILQFQKVDGVVENIDKTSSQLLEALERGKTIIVSTLQKYPVIADEMVELAGKKFAVIIDEAHSSQSGESSKSLKGVLSLEEAEENNSEEIDDIEERILDEMRKRGRQPNLSMFAFTATPKAKTLEVFGSRRDVGSYEPFSLYSMRQAIEEGFILDVLQNYTTFGTYWKLLKKIEDDPKFDTRKAKTLLRKFVSLHEHAIRKKMEIMVDHFHDQISSRIGGLAKAMIVTRSRLHCVRYKLALDEYLQEKELDYRTLVAFSGTVNDEGRNYSESGMNGFPEGQTARMYERPEYRFLVVANKFQTGFDQPLLHTMYVDKKLGGVGAVQTLSRLNRVYHGKEETMVLDFANTAADILESFQPYYEKTTLDEATDQNLLYDLQGQLESSGMYTDEELDSFAQVYFAVHPKQDRIYASLRPIVERFERAEDDIKMDFRGDLRDYVRLYAFLSQILTFTDSGLEKLYHFARLLRRYLPVDRTHLPVEIQEMVDLDSIRVTKTSSVPLNPDRENGLVKPKHGTGKHTASAEVKESLSEIIRELNEHFGTDFSDNDRVFIKQLEEALAGDENLTLSVKANTPENARLSFDHFVEDRVQNMVDMNFKFYKRITDDQDFSKFFLDWLFGRFQQKVSKEQE